jgi:TetR/AcrR family transcriptional regulator, transcriptional repressor for nem operon
LVKVTKEKLAENRAALVQAAGRLFRERGIDGVGVAEISKAAGLTHGALYGQFQSKDALAAEALAQGFKHSYARMVAVKDPSGPSLTGYLDFLVSTSHRDDLAEGCPLTASTSEIARQGEAVGARFAEGFQQMADAIEAVLGKHRSGADRRQRALAIIAAEIGAIAVARATAKSHPRLSKEVLIGVRRVLGEVGGEARRSPRKTPISRKTRLAKSGRAITLPR